MNPFIDHTAIAYREDKYGGIRMNFENLIMLPVVGNILIYYFKMRPVLEAEREFSYYKFWVSPFYVFSTVLKYHDICKRKNKSLKWFHLFQLNFALIVIGFIVLILQ